MNRIAKVVTILLLITLSIVPALAAAPCEQGSGCMACCSGMVCPMMGKMMRQEMAGHRGMRNIYALMCKNRPHSAVAVTDQRATDVPDAFVALKGISAVLPATPVRLVRRDSVELRDRQRLRVQAVLSTFLI